MGRTWTQAPPNLPTHPFFGQVNLALRPRFFRTLCSFATVSVGPYNPGASAPPFPDRRVGFTPSLQPAACAAHLGLAGLYEPSDTLTTGIPIPGARTPSFALVAGGIYAPTVATSVPFSLEAGWALRPQPNPPHNQYTRTTPGPHRYRRRASRLVPIALLRLGPAFNGVCHFTGSFLIMVTPCELTNLFCYWLGACRANCGAIQCTDSYGCRDLNRYRSSITDWWIRIPPI